MLKGKTVLLGVTGGIACYKSAGLASALVKQGANVQVLMTRNATEFIGPHTFESLTGNRVSVDTFDRNYQFQVEHIALADQADLVLVAPATANVLAKLAHGLADDMLTTTVLASCGGTAGRLWSRPADAWPAGPWGRGRCRSRRSCWRRCFTPSPMPRTWRD